MPVTPATVKSPKKVGATSTITSGAPRARYITPATSPAAATPHQRRCTTWLMVVNTPDAPSVAPEASADSWGPEASDGGGQDEAVPAGAASGAESAPSRRAGLDRATAAEPASPGRGASGDPVAVPCPPATTLEAATFPGRITAATRSTAASMRRTPNPQWSMA